MRINHPKYPWLEERTILLALTGSYAYGTNTLESDRDYKGICIPPLDYYFGLNAFHQYDTSGGKNFKNTKDDTDITIFHITKFVKNAMKGVPNNIELLFLRRQDYIKLTELGKMLIEHRHLFLSKQIYQKFAGYAYSQRKQLINSHNPKNNKYDTKLFMHTVRLLTSAIEILETGDFHTYRSNRQELLDCRNGKYTFTEALQLIETYHLQLTRAYEKSKLQETPNQERINELLIDMNLRGHHLYTF